jgi:hypothetical protein
MSLEKRYQVFVSSTYADLKEERQKVIQALMELDCIPAGMELFPAADEEQFEFIKRVIDDCDYYLLIIGGRYGSTTAQGISYTEQEYDYALTRGLKVVALLHENPDEISFGKSEQDPELRSRLQAFRNRVATDRLVRFWRYADQLPGIVALSLSKTIKMYPAVGWVRADRASSEELLTEINELRKQNVQLQNELAEVPTAKPVALPDLAGLDESIELHGECYYSGRRGTWKVRATWSELFSFIAPYLIKHPHEDMVKNVLKDALFDRSGSSGTTASLEDQEFQTISLQLKALGLVNLSYLKTVQGGMGLFWSATPAGERLALELKTVRTKQNA